MLVLRETTGSDRRAANGVGRSKENFKIILVLLFVVFDCGGCIAFFAFHAGPVQGPLQKPLQSAKSSLARLDPSPSPLERAPTVDPKIAYRRVCCFGCLKVVPMSLQVPLNGIEAVLVLTLIVRNGQPRVWAIL